MDFGDGPLSFLSFLCPVCEAPAHYVGLPFSEKPYHERNRGSDRPLPVWQRLSGLTVDDLTLDPLYKRDALAHRGCTLTGHVIAGHWHPA